MVSSACAASHAFKGEGREDKHDSYRLLRVSRDRINWMIFAAGLGAALRSDAPSRGGKRSVTLVVSP
jgi:hypothetical protein